MCSTQYNLTHSPPRPPPTPTALPSLLILPINIHSSLPSIKSSAIVMIKGIFIYDQKFRASKGHSILSSI